MQEQQKSDKPQGAGSLWNINSWHWEQKDFTKLAQELITEKLTSITLEQDNIKIIIKSLKNWEGNAEINVRKGKQIVIYDIAVEAEWFAETSDAEAQGTFKLSDINPDDLDYILDHIKSEDKTSISKDCERMIKKDMRKKIDEVLKNFVEDFTKREQDRNPDKLKHDAAERERVNNEIKQAREQNGDKKKQIFDEQKQKEQQMKQEFSQWNGVNKEEQ